ncbi:MAG: GNAT family N-acetyltransferase [Bacteroidia bacterium]
MLKGEKIHLRTLEPADAELIFKWENNPENWKVSSTLLPFSKHLIDKYVNSAQDLHLVKQVRFIIESLDGKALGTIDLFDYDSFHQRAGVGILIADTAQRGKGYAKEALELLIDYAFNHLLLNALFCNILEDNNESIALFKGRGFTITGNKHQWIRTPQGFKNELFLQLMNV